MDCLWLLSPYSDRDRRPTRKIFLFLHFKEKFPDPILGNIKALAVGEKTMNVVRKNGRKEPLGSQGGDAGGEEIRLIQGKAGQVCGKERWPMKGWSQEQMVTKDKQR